MAKTIIKKCVCGKNFEVRQLNSFLHKFCSRECGYRFRIKRTPDGLLKAVPAEVSR